MTVGFFFFHLLDERLSKLNAINISSNSQELWIGCWVGRSIEIQVRWAWWMKSRITVTGKAGFGDATIAKGLDWFLLRNTCRLVTELMGRMTFSILLGGQQSFLLCCTLQLIWLCSCVCVCWREGKVFAKLDYLKIITCRNSHCGTTELAASWVLGCRFNPWPGTMG